MVTAIDDLQPYMDKWFASTNDDETFVYDLGEANDPDMVMKMLSEPDIINMRKEAGVDLESQEVLSTISKHKIW